jgi:hypothetical protein
LVARVARVLELKFDLKTSFFARTPPSGWQDNSDLLVPDFSTATGDWTRHVLSRDPARSALGGSLVILAKY